MHGVPKRVDLAPRRGAPLAQDVAHRLLSLFGLDFGALVGGAALLTEVVFGLHGIGKLTYDSFKLRPSRDDGARDVRGLVLVAANAMVDLLYAWLDPRVRIA